MKRKVQKLQLTTIIFGGSQVCTKIAKVVNPALSMIKKPRFLKGFNLCAFRFVKNNEPMTTAWHQTNLSHLWLVNSEWLVRNSQLTGPFFTIVKKGMDVWLTFAFIVIFH